MYRCFMLTAIAMAASHFFIAGSYAQSEGTTIAPPADLHPPVTLDADTLRARLSPSQLGLRPNTSSKSLGADLPFGLSYSNESKGVVVPLDQKSEWGVGVGLNLNNPNTVELSPSSSLGLQPKRAPGVMLNKRF